MTLHYKMIIFIACFLITATAQALAYTVYVSPSTEVPVRVGRSNSHKIVAVLKDGTEVKVLKNRGTWALVKTSDGKKGWMPKRFLTSTPPPRIQLEKLEKEYQELRTKKQELEKELKQITVSGSDLRKQLSKCITERDAARASYARLREEAANVIQTKKMLEETQKKLASASSQIIVLKEKVNSLETSSNVRWFLAGAGVLITGWLIGLLYGGRRRRKPSLL